MIKSNIKNKRNKLIITCLMSLAILFFSGGIALKRVKAESNTTSNEMFYLPKVEGEDVPDNSFKGGDTGIFDNTRLNHLNGEGMLIGIIDCGVEITHEAFSVMPKGNLKYKDSSYLTEELKGKLNADLSLGDVYKNQKIVFAYDYFSNDTDATNSSTEWHGTHVAGISAGNNGKGFLGASPNAQLAVFKVFGNRAAGAADDVILHAIEDAITIDCDVINLSLGGNILYDPESNYAKLIEEANKKGVAVVISNGNDGASLKYFDEDDYTSSDHVDVSATNSPAFCKHAIGVGNSLKDFSKMAESSSWGTLPNLEIKPDVSAPGTDIYSSVTHEDCRDTSYTLATGTSMAAPNIAGTMANILQYIKENMDMFSNPTDAEIVNIAENILMSNADPIAFEDAYYSPRQVGAGIADYYDIENTVLMLSDENNGRPKFSLGEDEKKVGNYSFTFKATNFSNDLKKLDLSYSIFTDRVSEDGKLKLEPRKLNPTVTFYNEYKEIKSLDLNPKESQLIDVVISLSKEDKEYLDTTFENGAYVEGYIFVNSGESDLSVPCVAYYGDYSSMNIFYSKGIGGPTVKVNTPYYGLYKDIILGEYTFDYDSTEYTKEERQFLKNTLIKGAINPTHTKMKRVYFRTIRETPSVQFLIKNKENNNTIYGYNDNEIYAKWLDSCYWNGNLYYDIPESILFLIQNLPDNTTLEFSFKGDLQYYADEPNIFSFDVLIDRTAPIVTDVNLNGNEVEIAFSDNHYVQAYNFLGKTGPNERKLFSTYKPVFADNMGKETIIKEDISQIKSYDDIFIEIYDYAGNKSKTNLRNFVNKGKLDIKDNPLKEDLNLNKDIEKNEDFKDGKGGSYKKVNNGYFLTEYNGTSNEYAVLEGTISIKDDAFKSENLKTLILPSSLNELYCTSFKGAKNISKIIFTSYKAPLIKGEISKLNNVELVVPFYRVGYDSYNYSKMFDKAIVANVIILLDEKNSDTIIIKNNEEVFELPIPTKKGYEFIGWVNENNEKVNEATFDNNKYFALWEPINGNVTIHNGDKEYTRTYVYGEQIHLLKGDIFNGKYISNLLINGEEKPYTNEIYFLGENLNIEYVYKDIEIIEPEKDPELKPKEEKLNITLNLYDDKKETIKVDKDTKISDPTREGYTFDGWYLDEEFKEKYEDFNDLNNNDNLYAKWEKIEEKKDKGCGSSINIKSLTFLATTLCLVSLIYVSKSKKIK